MQPYVAKHTMPKEKAEAKDTAGAPLQAFVLERLVWVRRTQYIHIKPGQAEHKVDNEENP